MSLAKGARKTFTINEVSGIRCITVKKKITVYTMLRDAVAHCKRYLEKIPFYSNTWITEYKAVGLHQWSSRILNSPYWIAMRGLMWSRSSVQNQHIYCTTNINLQKICKKKKKSISLGKQCCKIFIFEKLCKESFLLQLEKITTWFDIQSRRWIF